jgi:hypothetical protein
MQASIFGCYQPPGALVVVVGLVLAVTAEREVSILTHLASITRNS